MAAQTTLTPEQRSLRARIAANTRWSREDPAATAARGQAGLLAKFVDQVDPDRVLPEGERLRRAEGDDLDSSVLGQVVLLADIAAVQNLLPRRRFRIPTHPPSSNTCSHDRHWSRTVSIPDDESHPLGIPAAPSCCLLLIETPCIKSMGGRLF